MKTLALLLLLAAGHAEASDCRQAINAAEVTQAIPSQLLAAIGHVESGRADPVTGEVSPWPWTADINGEGHYYPNKQQAIDAVRAAQARGVRSIDVGCMQINLLQHPNAFSSLDQAFDPVANANYGALFLHELHDQSGSWPLAAGDYHSQTPALGMAYERMVMNVWPDEKRLAGAASDAEAAKVPSVAPNPPPVYALPFRFEPGLIRMGAAVPPMGHPTMVAEAESPAQPGFAAPRPGRDLSAYRRAPIQLASHRGLL